MKTVLGALGAGIIAAALLAGPAEARCVSNGSGWHCWHQHHHALRMDRARLHRQSAELRHDRRGLRHLQARLHSDSYFGSSAEVRHDRRAMRRVRRELRADRRDLRHTRHQLRRSLWGE